MRIKVAHFLMIWHCEFGLTGGSEQVALSIMTLRNSTRPISQISESRKKSGLVDINVLTMVLRQQQKAIQRGLAQFHTVPPVWQRRLLHQEIHDHLPEGCKCSSISASYCVITYVVLQYRSKVAADWQGSNTNTPTIRSEAGSADWTMAEVQEFVPSGFEGAHVVSRDRSCRSSF